MEETNLQKTNEEVKVEGNQVTTIYVNPTHVDGMSCKSAKALYTIGTVVLVLGIIFGVILFICTCASRYDRWGDREFNPASLVYLVCAVLPSVIVFAFAHAVADITENTHKLANKKD